MAAMSMGDYGKPAPSGGGIRLRVLYDAIVNRELIDVETGGKALIMTSDEVIEDMKNVIDGKMAFDSPNKTDTNNFVSKYTRKNVLRAIKKQGRKNVSTEIGFTKIKKTSAFGSNKGSGGGADATALFEGAACWVTAYRYSLNKNIDPEYIITLEDLKSVASSVSTDKSVEDIHKFLIDDPSWMKSSIRTANKLLFYDSYRNNNFKFYRGTGIVNLIEKHYQKVNPLEGRPFANINKWTPADIWMYEEGSFDTSIITNELTFQGGFNKVLLDLLKQKKLIGVSLKKVETAEASIKAYNFVRHSSELANRKKFVSVGSKTLMNSMDVYFYGEGYRIQFRATDAEGKTWQGEMIGRSAKHGKIGGGVMNYQLEAVYGEGNGMWREYASASTVSAAARSGALDAKIYQLAEKNAQYVCDDGEVIDLATISGMRPQWKFSKYLGLTLVDILMSGNKKQRDEVATKIFLYATSSSDDSAPFIKVS